MKPRTKSKRLSRITLLAVFALSALAYVVPGASEPAKSTTIQETQDMNWLVQDAGNVECMISNFGLLGSTPHTGLSWSDLPSGRWPRAGSVEYLWAAGFWFGALKNGEPRVTTGIFDFYEVRPGPTALDRIYVTQEGAPGGNRLPSPDADDDGDGAVDEDRLDGRDNDGDGLVDEDFAAISNQMFFCEYNDTDPEIAASLPEHVPLEIQVQQTSLAWNAPLLDDFIAFDVVLTNRGGDPLEDLYAGFFADFDIGPRGAGMIAQDDLAGYWEGQAMGRIGGYERGVTLSLGYMWDSDGDGGQAGYVGILLLDLQGPGDDPNLDTSFLWHNYRIFSGRAIFQDGGDPSNDAERYQILDGTAPLSLPPSDPQTGFRPAELAGRADDWRVITSSPRIPVLQTGESASYQMALVFGISFDELVENAARAKMLYQGTRADCDMDPQTGENGQECIARWTLPPTVGVEAADLQAHAGVAGVQLRWSLTESSRQSLLGMHVQRADVAEGPYETLTRSPLAIRGAMFFEDTSAENGRSYWYRLVFLDRDGTRSFSRSVNISSAGRLTTTSLSVPVQIAHNKVEIRYALASSRTPAQLRIYDARGRLVVGLDPRGAGAGQHVLTWNRNDANGTPVRRGVYFVNLESGAERLTRKLVLLQE